MLAVVQNEQHVGIPESPGDDLHRRRFRRLADSAGDRDRTGDLLWRAQASELDPHDAFRESFALVVANQEKAKADIVSISSAIDQYTIENNGRYPESLEVLVTPDENGFTFLGQETVPKDPWGNEYGYEPPPPGTQSFRVISYGADGLPGGEADARDLDNVMIRNGEI